MLSENWLFVVLLVILLISALAHFAPQLKLIDVPSRRKLHETSTPTVGGLSIYLVLLVLVMISDQPKKLEWLFAGSTCILLVGLLDDVFDLNVLSRLLAQSCGAFIASWGTGITLIVEFPHLGITGSSAYWSQIIATILFVVIITNSVNLSDGIDGLAAALSIIGLISVVSFHLVLEEKFIHDEWIYALIYSVFGFLLSNLRAFGLPKVFLGDAGSLLIGFYLAWVIIYYCIHVGSLDFILGLLCVTYPLLDMFTVIVIRLLKGKSIFSGDRYHIHFQLLSIIQSAKVTLLVLVISVIGFNSVTFWLYMAFPAFVSFAFFTITCLLVLIYFTKRATHLISDLQ
ncbi:undecaprenyl/decaprenyl-phosphate alpha-N-acetylglucosaminyl 1-phosphate transferase [Litorivicinus sp.]|nr:undecaprenyl/decaprenyl-phosphate alpha-N-acetylglucosaminyl 1-phosphate transferase [Litorivicinus sp.]